MLQKTNPVSRNLSKIVANLVSPASRSFSYCYQQNQQLIWNQMHRNPPELKKSPKSKTPKTNNSNQSAAGVASLVFLSRQKSASSALLVVDSERYSNRLRS